MHGAQERAAAPHLATTSSTRASRPVRTRARRGPAQGRAADHPLPEDRALGLAADASTCCRRGDRRDRRRVRRRRRARARGAASTASSCTWRTPTRSRRSSRASTRATTNTAAARSKPAAPVRPRDDRACAARRRRLPGRRALPRRGVHQGRLHGARCRADRDRAGAAAGVDYISLSAGGKFEDAVHKPGEPLYPYTGYCGDRCMPGDSYPPLPHAHLAGGHQAVHQRKGFNGRSSRSARSAIPPMPSGCCRSGQADIVGMARQLLADPDWVRKVEEQRPEKIIRCIYCNVCKQLDENFKTSDLLPVAEGRQSRRRTRTCRATRRAGPNRRRR